MSPPPVDTTAADFYEAANFASTKHSYKIGDDINPELNLSDKYRSVNIGSEAKVIA